MIYIDIIIEKTTFSELGSLIDVARKDGIVIYAENHLDWFCAKVNGELVGFVACNINELEKTAFFKSDFVVKKFRRKGIYRKLFKTRLDYTISLGVKQIKANCTDMSLGCFLSYGFKVTRNWIWFPEVTLNIK